MVYVYSKVEYDSCPDFQEIFTLLKSGTTREIDGFLLQDGFPISQVAHPSHVSERMSGLRIACGWSCRSF